MLAKDNRLKKVRDFNLIMEYGRWVNGQFFTLKVLELAKNRDYFPQKEDVESFEKQLKLAFAVGVKVSKSAVKRNRLKRQMREVLRLLIKDEKVKVGYYLLLVAKKEALGVGYEEIKKDIETALKRAGVLK